MQSNISSVAHSEIPLKSDSANLFLEIMSVIAVFLFTITLSGFFMVNSLVANWDKGIVNGFTVQVMIEGRVNNENDLRVNKVLSFFENLSEVEKVSVVSDKHIIKLMKPWLGDNIEIADLPMPKLIDVRLKDSSIQNFDKIAKDLHKVAPYSSINSHQIWLHKLIIFAKSVKMLALSILLMVLFICLFSVFYATKTSLGIYQNIIEILHIMGATDNYIAKQYARRGFFIGLISGIVGVVLAIFSLWLISNMGAPLKGGIFDKLTLAVSAKLYICSIPMVTALISMYTSYITVKKVLGKIM